MTDIDLSSFDASDEAVMNVKALDGTESGWLWTFAGPGHAATIEASNKLARERLRKERAQEQAVVNGRKWKADEETPDDVVERNVGLVTGRLLGWSTVTMNGSPFPFSAENAAMILKDRRKQHILLQALEFLGDETAFTGRSAKTSKGSPSGASSSITSKKGERDETA